MAMKNLKNISLILEHYMIFRQYEFKDQKSYLDYGGLAVSGSW